jgi:hypothetical protein
VIVIARARDVILGNDEVTDGAADTSVTNGCTPLVNNVAGKKVIAPLEEVGILLCAVDKTVHH